MLRFWSHAVDNLVANLLTSASVVVAVVVVAGAFGLGAMVDSLRTLAVDPLVDALVKKLENKGKPNSVSKGEPPNFLKKLNKDNLPVFEFVLQRTFEYYRFNANLTLSLVLLTVSYVVAGRFGISFIASLIAALLFLWVAVQQRKVSL